MKLTDMQLNRLQNRIDNILDNRPNSIKLLDMFELFLKDLDQVENIENEELVEIPEPIGTFIIDNANGVMGADGMYYHYTEVIKLLKLRDKQNEKS
jgi:hypothetical protein